MNWIYILVALMPMVLKKFIKNKTKE